MMNCRNCEAYRNEPKQDDLEFIGYCIITQLYMKKRIVDMNRKCMFSDNGKINIKGKKMLMEDNL